MADTKSTDSKTNQASAARRTSSKKSSSSSSSSSSASSKIDPGVQVAARAQIDEGTGTGPAEALEKRAKEQEQTQQRELQQGVATGEEKKAAEARAKRAEIDPASARAGGPLDSPHAPGVQGGFVDQLSRRDGSDALEGHFVKIDLNVDDVPEELVASGRDYGVYLEPASRDPETGYPVTARVRLRDDSHQVVVVPYAALRPSLAGGR